MGLVVMSEHELQRVEVLSRVLDGSLRSITAAAVLAISPCQVQRLLLRYREDGAGAVRHGLRGRPSNNRINRGGAIWRCTWCVSIMLTSARHWRRRSWPSGIA